MEYSQHEPALDRLAVALAETITANEGLLPPDAQASLDTYIDYLESRKHFAQGESVLRTRLEKPFHTQQEHWLKQRLYRLYTNALDQDGAVSLGRGETLYRAVATTLWAAGIRADIHHRYQIVQQLMTLYRTAHRKGIESVARDLRQFAFERLPKVLGREQSNYQSTVDRVADTVHELIGPRDGLEFLIERIEHEPKWFRLNDRMTAGVATATNWPGGASNARRRWATSNRACWRSSYGNSSGIFAHSRAAIRTSTTVNTATTSGKHTRRITRPPRAGPRRT